LGESSLIGQILKGVLIREKERKEGMFKRKKKERKKERKKKERKKERKKEKQRGTDNW